MREVREVSAIEAYKLTSCPALYEGSSKCQRFKHNNRGGCSTRLADSYEPDSQAYASHNNYSSYFADELQPTWALRGSERALRGSEGTLRGFELSRLFVP